MVIAHVAPSIRSVAQPVRVALGGVGIGVEARYVTGSRALSYLDLLPHYVRRLIRE